MGFIGKDDSGDPIENNYNFTIANSGTALQPNINYFSGDTTATTTVTQALWYCGKCPRRFNDEANYEWHIMWHMLDEMHRDILKLYKPKKNWWGKLKNIE